MILKTIRKKFDEMESDDKMIITTEKDAVRLHKFDEQLSRIPLYVLPVKPLFLFNEEEKLNRLVTGFIDSFTLNGHKEQTIITTD